MVKHKAYIAGKLGDSSERERLELIDGICKSLGIKTFLPHRDVGIAKNFKEAGKIFRADIIEGFKDCTMVIASLDGLHIGAGTAWELGYAYAKKIPSFGIKTDESVEDAFEYLSSIIVGSMPIVSSLKDLEKVLKKHISLKS